MIAMQFREHQVESEQSNLYKFQCNSAMIGIQLEATSKSVNEEIQTVIFTRPTCHGPQILKM